MDDGARPRQVTTTQVLIMVVIVSIMAAVVFAAVTQIQSRNENTTSIQPASSGSTAATITNKNDLQAAFERLDYVELESNADRSQLESWQQGI